MKYGLPVIAIAASIALSAFASEVGDVNALLDDLDGDAKPVAAKKANPDVKPTITVEKPAEKLAEEVAAKPADKSAKKAKGKRKSDAKISSTRMDYDRKEGVIYFEDKVFVDDEEYKMHADRVFVFLQGTNDVKRIVALGNVAITNEMRTAECSKATFYKQKSLIVMHGWEDRPARLVDASAKDGAKTLTGSKIKFYTDSEQVEVENSGISVPGGSFNAGDAKKMLGK